MGLTLQIETCYEETDADGQFKDLRRKRDRFAEAAPDLQLANEIVPKSESAHTDGGWVGWVYLSIHQHSMTPRYTSDWKATDPSRGSRSTVHSTVFACASLDLSRPLWVAASSA